MKRLLLIGLLAIFVCTGGIGFIIQTVQHPPTLPGDTSTQQQSSTSNSHPTFDVQLHLAMPNADENGNAVYHYSGHLLVTIPKAVRQHAPRDTGNVLACGDKHGNLLFRQPLKTLHVNDELLPISVSKEAKTDRCLLLTQHGNIIATTTHPLPVV